MCCKARDLNRPSMLSAYLQIPNAEITKGHKSTYMHAVKCNLTEFITKSACVPLVVSGVDTYIKHVPEFHVLMDRSMVYIQEVFSGIFCSVAAHRTGNSPPTPLKFPTLFPLFRQCDGCLYLLLCGGSWLGCQDLPAMGAAFI